MSWWKRAQAGDRIVLIRTPSRKELAPSSLLGWVSKRFLFRRGRVFVVDGFVVDRFTQLFFSGAPGVQLRGQPPTSVFNAAWFRPVEPQRQKRSTDTGMRILRDLLKPAPTPSHEPDREDA